MHVGGSEFETILAAEGLAPVDDGTGRQWLPGKNLRRRLDLAVNPVDECAAAVEAWMAWAAQVERTYPFRKKSQRLVWQLYAQGVPAREIPRQRGAGDLRQVARTIALIRSKSPPAPPNPWWRGGNASETTTERNRMGVIRTLHYSKIALHRPVPLPPGCPAPYNKMSTDVFNDVDGTPHFGGIDVEIGGEIVLATWVNLKGAMRKAAAE